jgi:predicted DNA-binding protein
MPTHTRENVQVSVPLPAELHRRMKICVASQGITVTEFVRRAIEELLKRADTRKGW